MSHNDTAELGVQRDIGVKEPIVVFSFEIVRLVLLELADRGKIRESVATAGAAAESQAMLNDTWGSTHQTWQSTGDQAQEDSPPLPTFISELPKARVTW